MSPKVKPLSLAIAQLVACGALSTFAAVPAFAQAPGLVQTAPTQAGVVGRVDVTGTNIRRINAETDSPVLVITAEDMQRSGYTTVSEVLRDITANGQGTLSQGFPGAFAAGATGVALRGLNVGATLVLIDGLRMAGYPLGDDGQHNFVDISAIPFAAVERVEVLLDGASAVYGSDAIAGVVNVILKKSYQGFGLTANAGTTQHGGGNTVYVSATAGGGDASSNGYVAFEYRHQDAIRLSQRAGQDWTNFDWTGQGGFNVLPGARSNINTNPYLQTPVIQRRGGNVQLPADNIFLNSTCTVALKNANQCTFEDNWSTIQPQTQNVNILGSYTLSLGADWRLNLVGSYFDSQVSTTRRQTNLSSGSFAGNTAIGPGQIPAIVGAIAAYTVPATYPGNTFGAPANVRAILPDVKARINDVESGTTRIVAQLTGTTAGWDVNAAAGYTNVEARQTYNGYVNPGAVFAALNDPVNPYKITGGNPAEVTAKTSPEVSSKSHQQQDFAQLTGTRDLMQLDGGPLGIAVGAGWVYRDLYQVAPASVADGTVAGVNAAYALGTQTNVNAYAEINAPITKTLELSGAVRYDYYNTFGGSTVPKVGAKWVPIKEVGFRGTWGQGFRAPGPAESGESGSLFGFNSIRDPLLCPVSLPSGAPDTKSPSNVPAFCSFAPTYLQVANKNLQAEKSDNYTVGMILEPVTGWLTTLDYYYIKLRNQIIPVASTANYNPLDFVVRGTPQIVTFGDGRSGLSSVGTIQFATSPLVNAQSTTTTGMDFGTGYTWRTNDYGKFRGGVQWTHIFTYDLTLDGVKHKLAGTHGPAIISGDTGNPKDRVQVTLQWENGPWTATLMGNYIGKYDMTDPSNGVETCTDGINLYASTRFGGNTPPSQYCTTPSVWFWNLNGQYRINKAWTLTGSVVNLFDQKPPIDLQTYGAGGANLNSTLGGAAYNPALHQTGAVGRFYSLGFQYQFN